VRRDGKWINPAARDGNYLIMLAVALVALIVFVAIFRADPIP
jgi:hypothetical protein